jgi:hypothetical protein
MWRSSDSSSAMRNAWPRTRPRSLCASSMLPMPDASSLLVLACSACSSSARYASRARMWRRSRDSSASAVSKRAASTELAAVGGVRLRTGGGVPCGRVLRTARGGCGSKTSSAAISSASKMRSVPELGSRWLCGPAVSAASVLRGSVVGSLLGTLGTEGIAMQLTPSKVEIAQRSTNLASSQPIRLLLRFQT